MNRFAPQIPNPPQYSHSFFDPLELDAVAVRWTTAPAQLKCAALTAAEQWPIGTSGVIGSALVSTSPGTRLEGSSCVSVTIFAVTNAQGFSGGESRKRTVIMRFFIPSANSVSDGEEVYQRIRDRLQHCNLTDRRIYRVRFQEDGKAQTLAVGDNFNRVGGEPVLAIIEANDAILLCTSRHGVAEGEPVRIAKQSAVDIEEFTAVA